MHKCHDCDQAFANKSNLFRHRREQHGDVTLSCPNCRYRTSRQGRLNCHIEKNHPSIPPTETNRDQEGQPKKRKLPLEVHQNEKRLRAEDTPASDTRSSSTTSTHAQTGSRGTSVQQAAVQTDAAHRLRVRQEATQCSVTTTIIRQIIYPDGRLEVETTTLFDRPRTKDSSCQMELVYSIDSPTVIAAAAGKSNPGGPRCWGRRARETEADGSSEEEDTTPAQEIP